MICKVCGNSENNKEFKIKEMMFGFRDEFTYFECSKCGCLQIAEIPKNIGKYYPSKYYSFKKNLSNNNFIKQIFKRKRDEYALFKKGFIGRIIYKKFPNHFFSLIISRIRINYNSKILDVGCGSGNYLYDLKRIGFRNLMGIDPYINKEITNGNVKIYKKTINELSDSQKYDFIMFNHSFEHIWTQMEILLKVNKLLSKNGICLIRMPIKTEYIWNYYGVNWVQIDAPRHFFLHTPKSFELLIEKSGLIIKEIVYDSTEFQFWGSEQYKKNIPLLAENSYYKNPDKSIFTKKEIEKFKKKAKDLNVRKQGDQVAFFLTKKV